MCVCVWEGGGGRKGGGGEGKDIREEKKMGKQKGGGKEVCTVIGRGKGRVGTLHGLKKAE